MPFKRLFLFLAVAASLCAQSFRGSLSGTTTDPSGSAIAGAVLKLEDPATGSVRSVSSATDGAFTLIDLPVGVYTLTVSSPGFESKKIGNLEITVSKTTNITVQLGVAQQNAVIEVSASAVTLETTSTALIGLVDRKTVADLPLNGKDFRQMIKLSPGVSPTTTSVNGMRTNGNNFQIDGADNNDAFQNAAAVNQGGVAGIAGTLLPTEAIDQFSVQSNAGPEQGRNAGAAVNIVLKSGTNTLHGSLYYDNRNEALAARSPIQVAGSPKQVIRNNQFGFSVGGPVIKNKTFFFVVGESQLANANNSLLDTSPSDAYVTSAKSVLARNNVTVNPVSLNLLNFYPADSRTGAAAPNNFTSTGRNDYNSFNGVIKVDHRFNDRHTIFARYFGGTGTQTADVGSHFRDYFQVAPSHMHNVSVVENSILTPRMVNQVTLGTNYFLQTFNDANTGFNPIAAGLNTGVTEATLAGAPRINITGFDYTGASNPLGRIDTTGHVTDNLTYTAGKHLLKFGGEYRRAVLDVFYDINKRGTFTFDGSRGPWSTDTTLTTNVRALSDFLAGLPSNSNGATIARGQLQRLYLQNSFDWWAGDTWQINQRLTVNYGVRYTYQGILHDDKDSITNFIPSKGFVTPNKDFGPLYPKDWNNYAPRAGFAFTPTRDSKTVIRGSFGVFFDVPSLNFFTANTGIPNAGAAGVNANPGGANPVYTLSVRNVTIQSGVPIFGTATPTPPFGVFAVSQDYRTPYVLNFNMNVQHQFSRSTLLQVGYVGSQGRKLSVLRDINQQVVTNGVGVRPYAAQYPNLATINEAESSANSNYSSLQTQLRQSFWKGLTGTFNYTWAHAIDNTSDVRNTVPTNSYNLANERGNSTFDIRRIMTSFVSYEVPAFSGKAPRLTKGWQLNSLFTFHGGSPLNILAGSNVSLTGENRDRVDLVGDPFANVPVLTNTTAVQYFNKAAFAKPASGSFGNLGRNAIYGPGFGSVDFSVFKKTPITERITTEFRVETFNILNRTNWANPTTSFASGSFGQLTSTRNGGSAPGLGFGEPRNVQLALKVIF
jgi:hypothetical protein